MLINCAIIDENERFKFLLNIIFNKHKEGISMEKTIEELIYEETDKRLKEMETPEYKFPNTADKKDAVGIITAIVVCIVLILLCMIGVID